MREIRNVCNRASAFHVHLLKCQFEQGGIDHSDSEREDNGSMNSEISPTPALEPLLFGTEKKRSHFTIVQNLLCWKIMRIPWAIHW
jgi:hypothetical protein